jgi:CBS domain-containing membrane protein
VALPRLRLAGANWRDRGLAALGALAGMALVAWISTALAGRAGVPALVLGAPIGASAVLVFAIPSSPVGQPWPVIGGNIVSTLAGLLAARLLGHGALAAGAAVAGAILAMSMLRCLHPSGGGSALLGVLASPAPGFGFALVPIGLNAVLLVLAGIAFHRLSGHSYPHRPAAAPAPLRRADLDRALAEAGDSCDISPEDLAALIDLAERHARRG